MIKRVFIGVLLLVLVIVDISFAIPLHLVDVTDKVLPLVNSLRDDPVGFALGLDVSYEKFGRVWGKNVPAILYGTLPLKKSEILEEQAVSHVLSIDEGRNVLPIEDALLSTRMELYVAFEHIIPEERALKLLLSEMLLKAIMGRGKFSALLFPPYTDIAAVLASLTLKIDGSSYNVYVLVVEIGIAEDKPLGNYVVGKVSPSVISLDFFNREDRAPVFVWPNGIYFTVLGEGDYFVHIKKKVNGRVVDSIIKESFDLFPVRMDF